MGNRACARPNFRGLLNNFLRKVAFSMREKKSFRGPWVFTFAINFKSKAKTISFCSNAFQNWISILIRKKSARNLVKIQNCKVDVNVAFLLEFP